MLASSGYVSQQVQPALCQGCGECAKVCPFDAISMQNERSGVDADACMGCGVCVDKCEQGVLSLVRDPSKGEPLEIEALLAEAAAHSEVVPEPVYGTGASRDPDRLLSPSQRQLEAPTPGGQLTDYGPSGQGTVISPCSTVTARPPRITLSPFTQVRT